MLNQHAKWLEATVREIPWRKPIASMNLLVSSHVWRQDHNGFSHQDPGVTSVLLNKCFHNDHVIGIYFATDANMLLAIAEQCYKSTNKHERHHRGKQPAATFLTVDEAHAELEKGVPPRGKWASTAKNNDEADIVLAAAATSRLRRPSLPSDMLKGEGVKAKFVNVVDLPEDSERPENDQAISDEEFAEIFGNRQARSLRLPRLRRHHPSPDLGPSEPRQLQRPRLRGEGLHHHAVRHAPCQPHRRPS